MPDPTDLPAIRGRLDVDAVVRELHRRGSAWPPPVAVETVGSTNAEVAAAARAGAKEGYVLVAEMQTSGRGRLDRSWVSPRGSGLTLSVHLRPTPPPVTWGWLPIAAGQALLAAVRTLSDVDVALKWPNDLLLGPNQVKAAGILSEASGDSVVIGIGVNVSATTDELPSGATSLHAEGAVISREGLLIEFLAALETSYLAWTQAGGNAEFSGLMADYRSSCATLGREVTVQLPQGAALSGTAEAIDATGGLQVRIADGSLVTVVAADVVHVRPAD